ncbi:MAG: tellurite resistance TerB family protein [Gammaproteobacteria bacterium]|nr:tellurite resistance TerB family protein [Gammaproteobacteria bacterium]
MSTISPQTALVYIMVVAAIADHKLKKAELRIITDIVKILPIFRGFSNENFKIDFDNCISILEQDEGIETVLALVSEALPPKLKHTAYALACEVIAVDRAAELVELEWLALLRNHLKIEALNASAIEMAIKARYADHPAAHTA